MRKDILSMDQQAAALDNAPVAVFVRAASEGRLLYANRLAEELFWQKPESGEELCPFCCTEDMNESGFSVREFHCSMDDRIYQFSGRNIDWAGQPAQIEYIVDITDKKREEEHFRALEEELKASNDKMQDIINAIPGGVAIYKVSDIFETVYFSDGVPELSGYSVEEYKELVKGDAADMTYREDKDMVVSKAREVIETRGLTSFEFRKQHRDGHIVWVRVQIKWIGEEEGCPLLHCVFHNISDIKEAQLEMSHIVNSIPGGIASYQVVDNRFVPTFYSNGVLELSGHTREEYEEIIQDNALNVIYEQDRQRVLEAAASALISGEVLDVSYRMRHKDGNLIWVHLNGRRMGPLAEVMRFYAVFTGMSAETRIFQEMANETADGIYVISKETYELLYVNEAKDLFAGKNDCIGQKCYEALHGREKACEFCTLGKYEPDGEEHDMSVPGSDRYYSTRFRETDWNGIPAYVKFVRDTTEEVRTRKEKERLEQYFQTVLSNLPGGVVVVHYEKDGSMTPEFLSDGFAAMTGMTTDEAWQLYREDAMAGIHPDDCAYVKEQMDEYIASGASSWEIIYRLKKDSGYVWVKNTLSLIENEGGERRIYTVYQDMTKILKEQEQMRRQYQEMLMKHYHTPGADTLILGHCNITQNEILEIDDYTGLDILGTFGAVREEFFTGVGSFIVDEEERKRFYGTYLNRPSLEAFERGETEQKMDCFVKLPHEEKGRYVRFKMNLVATPDSGDITGVLTVTDSTQETVRDRIMYQLSASGYDFIADLDVTEDRYVILSCSEDASSVPPGEGCHSKWTEEMLQKRVVPKDRERFRRNLDTAVMLKRLGKGRSYTFAYSVAEENGDIRTKTMTVSAVDLRIGRVSLSRADITESVREQQAMLRVIAYTFELAGFIDIGTGSFTMYTRETVLENLQPHFVADYSSALLQFVKRYGLQEGEEELYNCFRTETMKKKLEEKPNGYDFLFPYRQDGGERYKQINVMWGDINHSTVCLVQADVTDMLAAERKNKKALENALVLAEEANRAKSDFLSTMSHDIRTPMNAIIGMTTLAVAHLGDSGRVADCLNKISISSRHLLSLINDILDMSKIESAQISLNRMEIYLPDMLEKLSAIIAPQAGEAGIRFDIRTEGIRHNYFYGDALRIDQILINILSNAVKYTREGGSVMFAAEEIPSVRQAGWLRYRFTVSDTGIGMTEEFLEHIFDPFARSAGTQRIEGTGLGLSITKGLVDLMGGEISVQSTPGEGSCFQVELECESAKEAEADRKAERKAPGADASDDRLFEGRLFLVAEDNEINAEILCELLSMYGAETVVRENGRQAVQAFLDAAPGTYDAVLMDIQMPEMNGYEAARAIRQTDRDDAAVIPIIAMTANAFSEDVKAAGESGMNAHVAKPVDVEMLRETLKEVMGRTK